MGWVSQQSRCITTAERLKSKKIISMLFQNEDIGGAYIAYPMRVVWMPIGEGRGRSLQVCFAVPKRNFRKAHERNQIRRRMKEAFRLQKQLLYDKLDGLESAFMLIYVAKESLPFSDIQRGVKKMIEKWPGKDVQVAG